MTYKIWNTDDCIGCGLCIQLCKNWAWNSDKTKAKPVKTIVNELGCNLEAEQNCPVSCIHHKELAAEKTKQKKQETIKSKAKKK